MAKTVVALVTAAGSGTRLGEALPKTLVSLSVESNLSNTAKFEPKTTTNKNTSFMTHHESDATPNNTTVSQTQRVSNRVENDTLFDTPTFRPVTILEKALTTLTELSEITHIVVTIPESHKNVFIETITNNPSLNTLVENKKLFFITGGVSRQNSILKALSFIKTKLALLESEQGFSEQTAVLIHDAARCFTPKTVIENLINTFYKIGQTTNTSTTLNIPLTHGVIPVLPIVDTIKHIENFNELENQQTTNVDRTKIFSVQTPQIFNLNHITKLHEEYETLGLDEKTAFTDDSSMLEKHGDKVYNIQGDELAFKITTPLDLLYARMLYTKP